MPQQAQESAGRSRTSFGSVVAVRSRVTGEVTSWGVRYTQGTKRVFEGGFTTEAQAHQFRQQREREAFKAARAGVPLGEPTNVQELVSSYERWLRANRSAGTQESARPKLAALVTLCGGRTRIDNMRPQDWARVGDRIEEVAPGIAPQTWNQYRARWIAMLAWGVTRGMCDGPAAAALGLAKKKARAKVPPYLPRTTIDEVYRLFPEEQRRVVVLLGEMGLRLREATQMTWDEVSPDFSTWTLPDTRSKTGVGRILKVPQLAQAALRAAAAAQGHAEREAPRTGGVFDFGTHGFEQMFHRRMEKARLAGVTPHTLRHSFASHLAALGVAAPAIQRVLGHTSLQMTMRYMCHAPSDAASLAMDAYDRNETQRRTG